MKLKYIPLIIVFFCIISIFLVNQNSITGYFMLQSETPAESTKLGYCPTLTNEAIELALANNYELVEFDSAASVLSALKRNAIDFGLIGRKAKLNEISDNIRETTIKSGITLVSNIRSQIDYSQINEIEVSTYLTKDDINKLLRRPLNIVYSSNKEETSNLISQGKIVLISWDDWKDNFELVLVLENGNHVKDFRGSFLYEFQ